MPLLLPSGEVKQQRVLYISLLKAERRDRDLRFHLGLFILSIKLTRDIHYKILLAREITVHLTLTQLGPGVINYLKEMVRKIL